MRVVFLGSPPFATPILARIQESEHEVACLVTAPARPAGRGRGRTAPSSLVTLAEESGLEVLRPENPHADEVLSTLRELAANLIIIASYGVILRSPLLELTPGGCLNVHASLLPRFRGASPIQHAILEGDVETGVCVQRVVQALDAGDVLLERRIRIGPDDTAGTLLEALAVLGGEAAVAALDLLERGEAQFTPQDERLVTYAPKLEKQHGRIDWTQPAESIERRVRAMRPWPVATTSLPGDAGLQVLRARVVPGEGEPGTILELRTGFVVATGRGGLELLEVKASGRAAMPADAFLRGARLEVGDRMGG